jgi:hypothetical protein
MTLIENADCIKHVFRYLMEKDIMPFSLTCRTLRDCFKDSVHSMKFQIIMLVRENSIEIERNSKNLTEKLEKYEKFYFTMSIEMKQILLSKDRDITESFTTKQEEINFRETIRQCFEQVNTHYQNRLFKIRLGWNFRQT